VFFFFYVQIHNRKKKVKKFQIKMALKWGILSAGLVSQDFANAVNTLNGDDHKLVAVAARDLERAKEFAEKFGVKKAYDSYLELAKDPNVEIAYVGTLNPWHYEVSVLMLEHGKHVLCEKPLCMNLKQSEKLIALAKEKGLFFMEGIWVRFFPSYQYVRKQIRSGALGEILSVKAEFGIKDLVKVDRLSKKSMGGGTILDMGVYTLQACQWVLEKDPISIKAKGVLNEEGVDVEMTADLDYGDGKKVQVNTSALNQYSNAVKIVGTKGEITIHDIFCSTRITDIDGKEKNWPLPPAKYDFYYPNSCGFRYEAEEVRKAIRAGKKEHETVPHSDSLGIARVQDELRRQLGVFFENHDD